MPVHNGRKYIPKIASGMVQPRNPIFGVVGKAVIFELPEATSNSKTIARAVDMSAVTIRSVSIELDQRVIVVDPVSAVLDVRILAVRPVFVGSDLHLTTYHVLNLRPDVREAVFGPTERMPDCALVVVHRLMSNIDIKQSIYVYLFRESHEIQV